MDWRFLAFSAHDVSLARPETARIRKPPFYPLNSGNRLRRELPDIRFQISIQRTSSVSASRRNDSKLEESSYEQRSDAQTNLRHRLEIIETDSGGMVKR